MSGSMPSRAADRVRMDALFLPREHVSCVDMSEHVHTDTATTGPAVRAGGDASRGTPVARLTFRRGMKGRFVLLTTEQLVGSYPTDTAAAATSTEEQQDDEQRHVGARMLIASAHFVFERSDGAVLAFVDRRPRCLSV